jgi:hypothetical protein
VNSIIILRIMIRLFWNGKILLRPEYVVLESLALHSFPDAGTQSGKENPSELVCVFMLLN